MKSWIQENKWLVAILTTVSISLIALIFMLTIHMNQEVDQRLKTQSHEKEFSIFLGQNLSTKTTGITGSTVHQNYKDFIEHSRLAEETYMIKEKLDSGGHAYRVYALSSNGHTYATDLDYNVIPYMDNYLESGRSIDNKTGTLTVMYQINDAKVGIKEFSIFTLLVLAIFNYLGVMVWSMIESTHNRQTKRLQSATS